MKSSKRYLTLKKQNNKLNRLDKYDQKKYAAKKKKLWKNLDVGEKFLILAERIKKKSAPGKFYKKTVQNISYFKKKSYSQ